MFKNGAASTLAIIDGIKQRLERADVRAAATLKISPLGDQSLFVRGAISGVVREGVIAAALTSLMILLFLGSWRSTVIIATSIPLAVLGAIAPLSALGETLNIMTLGGLALAVGILVDDATVTIENINWHLEQGKDGRDGDHRRRARRSSRRPSSRCSASASSSCRCSSSTASPRFLFVPMAEAVMFAMICSFILSRTLVPTMAKYLLQAARPARRWAAKGAAPRAIRWSGFSAASRRGFERVRAGYRDLLALALGDRAAFIVGFHRRSCRRRSC